MDERKTFLLLVMIENIVRSLLSCSYKIIFYINILLGIKNGVGYKKII